MVKAFLGRVFISTFSPASVASFQSPKKLHFRFTVFCFFCFISGKWWSRFREQIDYTILDAGLSWKVIPGQEALDQKLKDSKVLADVHLICCQHIWNCWEESQFKLQQMRELQVRSLWGKESQYASLIKCGFKTCQVTVWLSDCVGWPCLSDKSHNGNC